MNKTELRRVGPDEAALLQTIGRTTFEETFSEHNTEENMKSYLDERFSESRLAAELACTDSEFYFATLGNRVIGYLKVNFGTAQTELHDEPALEIERIYVLKACHGQNVGQVLIDKALQIARERSVDFVWLGVWEKNTRAIRFYTKNGFEVFGRHVFRLGNEEQTDLMMKRPPGSR